jgi:hypothetical protein
MSHIGRMSCTWLLFFHTMQYQNSFNSTFLGVGFTNFTFIDTKKKDTNAVCMKDGKGNVVLAWR